jgi:hypothetical protein
MRAAASARSPVLVAAVLALLYVVLDPASADLAAQEYRVDLFAAEGLGLWDNGWYAGHHLPGYSLLFPALGSLLGVRLAGAACAVAAAWLFARLAAEHGGDGGRAGAVWFAVGTTTLLVTGRLTFALGIAVGLGALVVAAGGGRPRATPRRIAAATALAALSALASPIAALFLALAAVAWWLARRDAVAAWVGAGALAPVAALVVAFPEGGVEPFAVSAFWPALVATVAVGIAVGPERRVIRAACALYAVALLASFALDTPMGGNATRLGSLAAGPVLLAALASRRADERAGADSRAPAPPGGPARTVNPAPPTPPRPSWPLRRLLLAALAGGLAYWQLYPPARDWLGARDDPAVEAAYHAPLLARLQAERARRGPFRLEIPFTRNHWEARHVALHVPLARGWQRQLDVARNALFYEGRLTPARYRRWLEREAVAFVAVPGSPLDTSGVEEARLVTEGRVPGLREVWRGGDWRLFAVAGAAPLARGPARVTAIGADEITLRAAAPGTIVLAVRFTPYWRLAQGSGCVERGRGDRVRLRLRAPGTVRLVTTFALGRVTARGPRCT